MIKNSNEEEKIYYSIFKKKIPESIKKHFKNISKIIDLKYNNIEINIYYNTLNKGFDIEAVELAGRYLKKTDILSEKLTAMVSLAETLPENQRFFFKKKSSRITGYINILYAFIRSLFKFTKGLIILKEVKKYDI